MANPNVLFKRGEQANLSRTATVDGAFYLTTDTHRLYVGQGSEKVLLNQTVQFVNNIAELTDKSKNWTTEELKKAHLHDLYYVLPGAEDAANTHGGNILAVWCYDKTQNDYAWVQINPDHNTYLNKLLVSVAAGTSNDANVNINWGRNDGTDKTITFNVQGDGKTIDVKAAANGAGFILKGDTYTLSRPDVGEIKLNSALGQNDTSIKLVEGDNITIENGTANNEIKISSWDTRNSNVTLQLNSTTGALDFTILDTKGTEKNATTGGITMKYGAAGDLTAPLGGTLAVYSKTEIDTKLNNLNGLTFIGSVGENGTYIMKDDYKIYQGGTALTMHNGDMFLVADDNGVKYGNDAYAKTGDLLIAVGTETNGIMTSYIWEYIPSGDDAQLDTSYHFDGAGGDNTASMTVRSKTTFGDEGVAGKMIFNAGTATTITSAIDGNTAEKNEFLTVTVGHANVANTKTEANDDDAINLSAADSVDVITGVTVNAQGHVENVTATRVLATRYNLSAYPKLTGGTSGIQSSVQVQQGLVLNGTETLQTTGYKLQSDSLSLSVKDGTNIQIDCVWGDFNTN